MEKTQIRAFLLACFFLWQIVADQALATTPQREYVTTSPVLADGVLYVASTTYPDHRGHLRAIDILDIFPVTLWDAGARVPLAGLGDDPGILASSDPPSIMQRDNLYRSLFTNVSGEQLALGSGESVRLQAALAVDSLAEAEILLHAVRGRLNGTSDQPVGTVDDPERLWGISRSSPVLVGGSPVRDASSKRDRVLYAGAEDGMLHAFFVSSWDADSGNYLVDDPDGGAELWAYLPGSFLPYIKDQPFADPDGTPAVHLDGSPVVRELFLDLDGDGRRSWSTLLVATGTVVRNRRSGLFVLDVTDPYQPLVIWEKLLPGSNVGRTRGVTLGNCGEASNLATCIYLTADFCVNDESAGIQALALTLETGELLWQFTAPYQAVGPIVERTAAVPALMDLAGDGYSDTLIFGDLIGQLWALALTDGQVYGGAPVFRVPGGTAEPIGAGVAVHKRVAFFGTGGVEGTDDSYQYALYAVEVLPEGSRLRWRYSLSPGEKVWEAPVLDASGNLLFATSLDYRSLIRSIETPTSGRVVALNSSGEEEISHDLEAAALGRVVTAPGVAVAVTLTGEVTQMGVASRLSGPPGGLSSVKILSWRQR